MPGKRVFPGGSVEPGDRLVEYDGPLSKRCIERLARETDVPELAMPLALAAIRETFEETGLALGTPAESRRIDPSAGASWESFFSLGLRPAPSRLRFVFRAITPAELPIRFDARFFLAFADVVHGGDGAPLGGSGELLDLGWTGLRDAVERDDLPRVTRRVLREALAVVEGGAEERRVPFYSGGSGAMPRFLS